MTRVGSQRHRKKQRKINITYFSYFDGWDSLHGIVNHYGLDGRGSNRGGGEIFRAIQNCRRPPPDSFTMDTGTFLGVKRPDRVQPPYSSAEVANGLELQLCSPLPPQ
jgi:hypothetical protein